MESFSSFFPSEFFFLQIFFFFFRTRNPNLTLLFSPFLPLPLPPLRTTQNNQQRQGLDGRGAVVVVGATNRVDAVDGALRRPGRFDRELLFPLPNASARAEILSIHTRSWSPSSRPSQGLISELASRTAGYGGADLKALAAEASLRALRRTFPQIYESETRVSSVDPSAVVVQRRDFVGALKAIVPSSHRAAAAHARPLAPAHLGALGPKLADLVRGVKAAFGPATAVMAATAKAAAVGGGGSGEGAAAAGAKNDDDDDDDDDFLDDDEDGSDEEVANASAPHAAPGAANTANADPENNALSPSARLLAGASSKGKGVSTSLAAPPPPPPPRAARAVVCGPAGCGASDVAAALLAALEGLPLHSLGLPCLLLSDGGGGGGGMHGADEALVLAFAAARRAAPSVLFLPQAELWWSAAPRSLRAALRACLSELPPGCPVLLVASSDCGAAELPAALAALLGVGNAGGEGPSSSSSAAAALNTVLVELSAPDAAGRAGALAAAASELARPPARRVRKAQLLAASEAEAGAEAAATTAAATATAATATAATAAAAPAAAAAAAAAAPPKPSKAEKAARLAADDAALRALRVALRSVASRLLLDRRFVSFSEPRPPSEDDSADEDESDEEDEEFETPTMASILAKVDARQCPTVSSFLELVSAIPAHALALAEKRGGGGKGKGKNRASVGVGAEATARATLAFALQDEAEGLVAARVPAGLAQRCDAIEEERRRRASAGEEEEEEEEEEVAEEAAAAEGEAAAAAAEGGGGNATDLVVPVVAAHLPPRRPALPPASADELALARKVLDAAVRATEGATLEAVGAASAALFAAARARRAEEDRGRVSREVLAAVLGDAATL